MRHMHGKLNKLNERIGDRLMNDAMHYAMVKPWYDRADDNSLYGASLELIHAVRKLFATTGVAGVEEALQRLEAQNEHQAVKAMIAALEEERAVSSVKSGAKYAKAVKDIDSFLAKLKQQKQEEQKHMSKKYTKKQIQESIRYWQKVLKSLDESVDVDKTFYFAVKSLFKSDADCDVILAYLDKIFNSRRYEDAAAAMLQVAQSLDHFLKDPKTHDDAVGLLAQVIEELKRMH